MSSPAGGEDSEQKSIKGRRIELNRFTFRKIWSLIYSDPTGASLAKVILLATRDWFSQVEVSSGPQIVENNLISSNPKVLFVVHFYFEEYLDRLVSLINAAPDWADFLITSPNPESLELLAKQTANSSAIREFVHVPNRGRNFAPFFVESQDKWASYKYVAHLHTKRSIHTSRENAQTWSDRFWNLLNPSGALMPRLISLFEDNADFRVAYPLMSDVMPVWSYGWLSNRRIARRWFRNAKLIPPKEPFTYPIGGMFLVRSSYLIESFNRNHSYADFPLEKGQLDGTYQHLLERLIGVLSSEPGSHLIYDTRRDRFVTDINWRNDVGLK